MNKKKDSQSQQADIHLIVDLPMEAVIEHIASINGDVYQVEIYQHNSDEASFRIIVNRDTISIDTQGIVRRWNGTLTRLDANYNIQLKAFSNLLRGILLWCMSWLVGGGFCAFYFSVTEQPVINALMGNTIGFVAFSFLMLFAIWADNRMGSKYNRSLEHRAYIYVLIDALSSDLKAKAASLSFDGTEADLSKLLQEESHKNFRLSADGEIEGSQ